MLAVVLPLAALAQKAQLAQPVQPPAGHPLPELFSGYRYQPEYVREIQNEDIKNPGTLWRNYGRRLWSQVDGEAGKSCADCHNVAEKAMHGVGARYPKFYPPESRPITLSERINLCRTLNMKAKPWPQGSSALVAMTTYVSAQSRGMPVRVKTDGQAKPFFEQGRDYYYSPRGERGLSCAACHERKAGKKLDAATLSQGHSNGFPAYKIATERVEPLHRQFQRCNKRVGAEPLPLGADPYVNLELYLAWRGMGLLVETPAVRNW
ncbi:sulfur oxidation c-type cytochrome SoxA [Dichotomicrobium thermohalophilum]|uniref:SoxAX cytochrome complex subunit A n=1 Tax=Dichotomicrobium thermohalophilum TaxID=933063 RepID=A0A397Q6V7_9HYPH|nr:sulfur oxidation c-type cytochrome SoxA [Dichotomicrobium thermohalophilum]RIA55525.1 sulfur-oxidizing protein SoxA [Dichotomicrobium thermohalophilum]